MKKSSFKSFDACTKEVFHVLDQYAGHTSNSISFEDEINQTILSRIVSAMPALVLVIDLRLNGYVYINAEKMLGYSADEFMEGGLERALQIFPAEHAQIILQNIFPVMFKYFEEQCQAGNSQGLHATYPTQLIHRDGTRRWFKHTVSILTTDAEQKPHLLLKTLTDIDDIKKDRCVDFTIMRGEQNHKTEVLFKEQYLPEFSFEHLSVREVQVLQLISQGFTNHQIAEKLFISVHTVQTHRKNIMRKTSCKGTAELAVFALKGQHPA